MKINKIKALCKAKKQCVIYESGARRMLGTLNAVYPAEGLSISKRSMRTLFDWPDVEDELNIETMLLEDSRMCPHNFGIVTTQEMTIGCPITHLDEAVIPLGEDGKLYFVKEEYVNAAEKTEGYTKYYLARNILGEPLVVVSDGLITTAIIKPLPRRTAERIRLYMESVGRMTARGWVDEEATAKDMEILPGQIDMDEMLEEANKENGEKNPD